MWVKMKAIMDNEQSDTNVMHLQVIYETMAVSMLAGIQLC